MKLKKILLIGGIAALGLTMVGGFGVAKKQLAYWKQDIQQWADRNSDPEHEITRLKGEVAKLNGVENGIKDDLAKEIAAVEKLNKQTAALRAAVEDERAATLAFGDEIRTATDKVKFGGRVMDLDEAKRKLANDVKAVQTREKTLGDMENVLAVRQEAKSVLYAQLDEIEAIRTELSNELDALETEYKSLKLQAMKNKYHRDDSKLSEIREGIEKLKDKMAEKRARVGLDTGKGKTDAPVTGSVDDILAPLTGK